jgi:hypothetical protein
MSAPEPFDDRLMAEIAAAADGTLDAARLRALETLAAHDPAIAQALERQRRAVAMIRGASQEVHASLPLRESLERERDRHARGLHRRRGRWLTLALAGAAVAAVAVVIAASGAPTVEDAAAFSGRPPSAAAPAVAGEQLRLGQDGIAFPAWTEEGWRATGSHRGEIGGRAATTVYYVKDGREVAYTIVGGEALDLPRRGVDLDAAGTPVRLFDLEGRTVAAWRKDGHTCVLSGDGIDGERLAALAGSTDAY